MSRDDDNLQVLAIFHFVVAGFATLVSLFPTVHLLVGIGLLSGFFTEPKDPFPYALIGWIFVIGASCWIVLGLVFAFLLVRAGRCLKARRRYQFCLVMAGVACIFMPFGTILGVLTIFVLTKESIRAQFLRPASPGQP